MPAEGIQGILIPFFGTFIGAACVFFMKKTLRFTIHRALTGICGWGHDLCRSRRTNSRGIRRGELQHWNPIPCGRIYGDAGVGCGAGIKRIG